MSAPNTPLSAFLPYVLPYVATCPDPVAEFQLRMAAIEFCERTRCWRHIISVAVAANNQTIAAPTYSTIHEIEEATFNGKPLNPTQYTATDPNELTGLTATGDPVNITQIESGVVALYPFKTGTLRLSAFLKPMHGSAFGLNPLDPLSDAYNVVPEFLLRQHAETIARGALARIYGLPNEQFSNPNNALFYAKMFDEACGRNFASNLKGQQRAPIRTKAQWM